jgi:membrane associated rhomboid family serine protease
MGGLIPLTDASRRPVHFPVVTICIIVLNFLVFALELNGGEAFVLKWSAIPAHVTAGHDWVTLLTAMFMHGSWSHILGNMVFLWAFGPEIEDAMGPAKYGAFYLLGGLVAMLAEIALSPSSNVPNLGASGAIAAVMGGWCWRFYRRQYGNNDGQFPYGRLIGSYRLSRQGDQEGSLRRSTPGFPLLKAYTCATPPSTNNSVPVT